MVITTKRTAAPNTQTQLKIKTGAVNRLVKERGLYLKEIDEQQARVEAYRQRAISETDETKRRTYDADLRKQNEVLEETVLMVPHMERRIRDAMQDLDNLVLSKKDDTEDIEALASAKEALAAASSVLASTITKSDLSASTKPE
ncbi:hypothetical protein IWW37_005608 [Coemansia sp. RSA 2050]|nr:hypothetical protein IWW37_005608 [Coemansia sp. RSA 2050]KAJ2728914.1 hypothetical protein IW152_005815 [Coemansia sp. BCRC 34962]